MQRDDADDSLEGSAGGGNWEPDEDESHATDADLVERLCDGEGGALRELMARYDRLVRYAVFRLCRSECLQDPTFLDARASEAWTGFVRSVQRSESALPVNIKTYLIQIAKNKCADALRRPEGTAGGEAEGLRNELSQIEAPATATIELLIRAEEVLALRECIDSLTPADKKIYGQLEHLVAGRWKQAANALGMPESSLRSRWSAVLGKLKACLSKKTAINFAPRPSAGDS